MSPTKVIMMVVQMSLRITCSGGPFAATRMVRFATRADKGKTMKIPMAQSWRMSSWVKCRSPSTKTDRVGVIPSKLCSVLMNTIFLGTGKEKTGEKNKTTKKKQEDEEVSGLLSSALGGFFEVVDL